MIDAKEDRDVATAEIPGAFLQTYDTSVSTHLNFDGMMAELLARIYPYLYRKYIITNKKCCKIIYAEFLKALYGTLDASLLFWVKLSNYLERWGFKIN